MIRHICLLATLGAFAGFGLIEVARFWTPAMPGDVRGFIVALLVLAAIHGILWGGRE
jgi:hypothetical protein